MSETRHISSADEFQNLISTTPYVIADFYADWCGPCRMVAPVFAQLAAAHGAVGKLAFAKVDVDALQPVAAKYDITAMPTFIVFCNGQPANRIRGANQAALRAAVQDVVKDLPKDTQPPAAGGGEGNTVSGGYAMESGSRPDWKMSLRG